MQSVKSRFPEYQPLQPDLWHYQRSLIEYEKLESGVTAINIDEDKIDLYRYFDQSVLAPYTPKVTLAPWDQVQKVCFDIETTGLDPETCEVKAIGVIDSHSIVYNDGCNFYVNGTDTQGLSDCLNIKFFDSEEDLLRDFLGSLKRLKKSKISILAHYNGWIFDWQFLKTRCKLWGINFNFYGWENTYRTVDSTAQRFGKPITDEKRYPSKTKIIGYHQIYVDGFEGVDLLHKVMSWDFVFRKLTQGYSLKAVPYELNLTSEVREELTFEEMLVCYETNDWKTLLSYLKDDLKATLLMADYLLPPYYYQAQICPWIRLQSIFTRGNGGKWNEAITSEYLPIDYSDPKGTKATLAAAQETFKTRFDPIDQGITTEKPVKYTGGLTGAVGGLYWSVGKIDVASLYPSIMLNYGIYSYKDINANILRILKFCKDTRLEIKARKNLGTASTAEKLLEGALKVLINSGYGGLATTGIIFNDYEAAALVTAYGRAILKLMVREIEKHGGINIEIDTDGIYFAFDGDHNWLTSEIQKVLPKGIEIENELFGECIYIPPKDINFTEKVDEKGYYPGLRKNYIIGMPDKMKVSGKFRKRDQPNYLKKFLPDCVEYLIRMKKETGLTTVSSEYFDQIISDPNGLESFIYAYKKSIEFADAETLRERLLITRKARSNESKIRDIEGIVDDTGVARYYLNWSPDIGAKGQYINLKNPYKYSLEVTDTVRKAYHMKVDDMARQIIISLRMNEPEKINLQSDQGQLINEFSMV